MNETVATVLGSQMEIIRTGRRDLLVIVIDRQRELADGGVNRLLGRIDIVYQERMGTILQIHELRRRHRVEVPAGLGIDLTVHGHRSAVTQRDTVQLGTTVGNDDAEIEDTVATAGIDLRSIGVFELSRSGVKHRITYRCVNDTAVRHLVQTPLLPLAATVFPTDRTFLYQRVATPDNDGIFDRSSKVRHLQFIDTVTSAGGPVILMENLLTRNVLTSDGHAMPFKFFVGAQSGIFPEDVAFVKIVRRMNDRVTAHAVMQRICGDHIFGDDHLRTVDVH